MNVGSAISPVSTFLRCEMVRVSWLKSVHHVPQSAALHPTEVNNSKAKQGYDIDLTCLRHTPTVLLEENVSISTLH